MIHSGGLSSTGNGSDIYYDGEEVWREIRVKNLHFGYVIYETPRESGNIQGPEFKWYINVEASLTQEETWSRKKSLQETVGREEAGTSPEAAQPVKSHRGRACKDIREAVARSKPGAKKSSKEQGYQIDNCSQNQGEPGMGTDACNSSSREA